MTSSASSLLFVIVGRNEPLYETEIHKRGTNTTASSDGIARQNYFVLHSALDLVDKAAWNSSQMYLKVVDKVNQQQVSCFLTAGNIKFLLLHNGRGDDAIRNFFQDVYELYVKFSMNPFYQYDTPIRSIDFENRVQAVARRYNLS